MEIKFKEAIDSVNKYYNHLQKRQRTLALVLVAALLFSVYYNLVYKRGSSGLQSARTEMTRIHNELVKLRSQTPNVDKERDALNYARKSLDRLKDRLASVESGLPTQGRVPQILGELVRQASGYSIDFVSIKQRTTTRERREYPELNVDMKFNSGFSDLVNYINRVESVSPFLKVTDVRIEEMKDNFGGTLTATLTFITLIGESEKPVSEKADDPAEFAPTVSLERNPFISKLTFAKGKEEKVEFRLSGIIARGKQPTAVINDEVYKVGDSVNGRSVKKILPNMVILSDGSDNIVLTLK